MKAFDFDFDGDTGEYRARTTARGSGLLIDPLLNKGTAFDDDERELFNLRGLLPRSSNALEMQARRVYASICRKHDPLEKYIGLAALQARNEHLFYQILNDHLEEFLPIVYTPTVGLACREFSNVFRRGRGLWITRFHRGRIADVLANARYANVKLIVATDNEAILGIGDQGAGGMAISVGKLSLYCAGAGIHPSETLPISLDVGTNNQALLADEFYLGVKEPRLRGPEYEELIEEFVLAVQEVFPGALIQWEDFRKDNALSILQKYRHRTLSFNDDIQGTGAVALAGIMSGCRVQKRPLQDQRIVIFGAGAAGMGIAKQLRAGLAELGLDQAAQQRAVAVIDSRGLLASDVPIQDEYKKDLAWSAEMAAEFGLGADQPRDLAAVIEKYHPSVLIGSSGQAGAFTESIIRSMAAHCERPMIFPFSNPTDCCEAIPQNLLNWTDGRALIATGSPFAPVEINGRSIQIGQGNNVFIFPGLGLGALLAQASEVTDSMITATSRALADQVTEQDLECGLLFPAISRLREVSESQAIQVIRQAIEDGVAGKDFTGVDIPALVRRNMWRPSYPELIPV
jgi:malate dehydrogenase (oxaloacetate-decarboxylating)